MPFLMFRFTLAILSAVALVFTAQSLLWGVLAPTPLWWAFCTPIFGATWAALFLAITRPADA